MVVIQVPGTGSKHKAHKHVDPHVGYTCTVDLHIEVDGDFERDAGGDDFNPPLPTGDLLANTDYQCISPSEHLEVKWTFTAKSNGSVTHGKIFVKKNAAC
jgi:hypothetical protein